MEFFLLFKMFQIICKEKGNKYKNNKKKRAKKESMVINSSRDIWGAQPEHTPHL